MPAYVLDLLSDHGPQRRRYTLDDDRPLRGQLEHVLGDLERGGVVLHGSPTDELAVYWAGRELDASQPPRALGVTPERPLELRMQRRRAPVALPAPMLEGAPEAFVLRGVYAGTTLGFTAGALAWALAAVAAARPPAPAAEAAWDVGFALAWGVLVGAGVMAGQTRRVGVRTWRGALVGMLAGGAGAVAWSAVRLSLADGRRTDASMVSFGWRLMLWGTLAALVAAALVGAGRLRTVRSTAARDPAPLAGGFARAVGWALLAGAAAGAVGLLPGEAALWQALAAALAGAGTGAAVGWATTFAAPAVFELEAVGADGVGVAGLREWVLPGDATVYLRRGAAATGGAAAIVGQGGRYRIFADAGSPAARELRHDDRLTLGSARYRFRRRVVA